MWMTSSQAVRASGCQCQCRKSPWFDPSILRHSGICGTEDKAVLINLHKKQTKTKIPLQINVKRNDIENQVSI
jgi:hypothetical protein